MPDQIFIATLVHTPSLGVLEILVDQLVVVDAQGIIQAVHSSNSPEAHDVFTRNPNIVPTRLPSTSFLIPTFVDLHLHAPQFLYLGTGLHLPLMVWLNEYAYKAEERMDADPVLAKRVYARLAERLVEVGTGAVLLFGTIKAETNLILAEVMQSKGLRAFVGKLSMDKSGRPTYIEPSAEGSLQAVKSFISRCQSLVSQLPKHQQLVEPVITPRFVPTCSDELLEGLGKLAATREKNLRIQSHLAEARDQVDWVRSERHAEDIDVFDRHRLLTPRTVQAHCTFLDPPSLSRLHERKTSIAHCPLSNAYFSSKPFPLREALNAQVSVGLGTDVAGGYQIDIMSSMRSAVSTSRVREGERTEGILEGRNGMGNERVSIDWKDAVYLATKGGAAALQLSSGQFAVGQAFDAQRIDLLDDNLQGIGSLDFFDAKSDFLVNEDAVEKWWCLGDTRNRSGMWVQGKKLM